MKKFLVGLDLGQASDYTALTATERIPGKESARASYHVRHIERFELNTPYPVMVDRVFAIMGQEPLKENATLIVDATGVGRPVVDMLRASPNGRPVPILITGGDAAAFDWETRMWKVPKRDLVGAVQVLLQTSRLKFAQGLPLTKTLAEELLAFKVKINARTAHDSYGEWRDGQHDDLVLSLAMALWFGETQMIFNPADYLAFVEY